MNAIKTKKKRWSRKKIILCIIAVVLVLAHILMYPEYRNFREAEFDTLAKISDGTFHRAGDTVVYDRNGKKIGATGNEKYYYINLKDVSVYVTKGYIAKEDNSFYTHHGVSYTGMLRAAVQMIIHRGTPTQGGSTITQQLVKNTLLSQERTFKRKILEYFAAKEVEKEYSKAKIMEFYVNSCYYGNGCYGIEGASRYYFNKHASELSVAEAAMLVATSNLPNVYNPAASYSRAMKQKDITVEKMLKNGVITKEQAEEAKKERPEIVKHSESSGKLSYLMTYAMNEATLRLMKHNGFTFRYAFAGQDDYESYRKKYSTAYQRCYNEMKTGGYTIRTSLDQDIQKKTQSAIDRGLAFSNEKSAGIPALQGAAVVVDNSDGMVVAAVGGRSGSGEYNRACQAARQPGSAIKPLVDYGPALDKGKIYAGTVMDDKKTTVEGFTPKNYDGQYHGKMTIREALVRSYNTVALQTFRAVGKKDALKHLEQLQFSTLSYADQNAAAVSIGGLTRGTTVSDMARAYTSLARDGRYSENGCIAEMSNFENGVIYRASQKTSQAFSRDTAFILSDMLQGQFKEKYGAGYGLDTKGQNYAAKTGTTNSSKDLWLSGYSRYYTTSLWLGYDTPKEVSMKPKKRAEIWTDIMNGIHEGKSPKEFTPSDTVQLRNGSGETRNINYRSGFYSSRPKGWDYASSEAEKQIARSEKENAEKKREQTAEKLAKKLESMKVSRYEDISGFETVYQECLNLADEMTSKSKSEEIRTRAENRYSIMNSAIKTLSREHDVYTEAMQEKTDAQSEIDAQKSKEKSAKRIEDTRTSLVRYYISELNKRNIYSQTTENLAEKGVHALEKCSNYPEYEELKKLLEKAISKARKRPSYEKATEDPSSENYMTD
jgi:penicillin-binding protein 1A